MSSTSDRDAQGTGERTGLAALVFDSRARSLFFQVVLALAIIAMIVVAVQNAAANLAEQGREFGFDFFDRPSDIQILTTFGTWLVGYEAGQNSIFDVFLLSIANTLIVAVAGIFFATIWGFLLGIFRLSHNFVLNSFATFYVELLRNIPLLLQIFFWTAVLRIVAPSERGTYGTLIPGLLQFDAKGIYGPYPVPHDGFALTMYALVVGIIAAWGFGKYAAKQQDATGKQLPTFRVGLGLIIGLPVLMFLVTGRPMSIEWPNFVTEGPVFRRGFERGVGSYIAPEFMALFLALTTYTAAFIAEIVRAGIQAVPKGQSEASAALGLPDNLAMRKVILPQAFRVIVPPLTSQYLNLTKNSSLAAAIGYPELVAVFAGTTLNQVGRAIEIIAIVILVYLTISLLTSAFMNWFNNRVKLVER
ncbi:amino acid ABC transporter permease [Tropicibacter naphthalenivorans]|uniref:Putative glutamine ABC transporter permease protein GlnM n=1 Tax=Tropicibacter naphthalenivorans TaxID=441103 RepID=A0A0P1GZJ7_9RHOB|nr:ABC transporter permease subunit [Tropicibacter naphthalenivorans]CUH82660.1 putative glutamine ABC transporter permease protein GlnM [Tropicibacter naphthalenivorans]SMD10214.1 general L-amino acid transport system permease protein [Tropicibacter naphthalenivorans]